MKLNEDFRMCFTLVNNVRNVLVTVITEHWCNFAYGGILFL